MAKHKVPPTSATSPTEPLNRAERRHPEGSVRSPRPKDEAPARTPREEMSGADRTPDDLSVRAKSTGHGKKTADKWNQ